MICNPFIVYIAAIIKKSATIFILIAAAIILKWAVY